MAKKFFDYILQGSEATEENAYDVVRGLDWQEVETHIESYPDLNYIDTVNGVGIWYAWKVDSYYFTDESEDLMESKKVIKISKDQLQKIIKEGVEKLHRKTILENEKKNLMKELSNILFENEVASSEVMDVLNGYLEAALWTEADEIGQANLSDIADNSKVDAYRDIKTFMEKAFGLLDELDPNQIGHDLWLTRNGHGAGFFDRNLGDVGEKLSDIARGMGQKYVGWSDGEIVIE